MGLELDGAAVRRIGHAAVEAMAEYYESLPELPILPDTTAAAVRRRLAEPLPREGTDPERLLERARKEIFPLSRHNGHPRFFGYITSPGTAVAALGDWLAGTLNANVTSWRSAPAATEIEHITIDWLKELLGYPAEAAGLFVSGGSMANLAGLAAARSVRAPEAGEQGMGGQRLRIYASDEGHFSIRGAAGLLGLGRENVCAIRTDARFRMDAAELERQIEADAAAGYRPMCIVASLGTTSTGAVDPLEEVAAVARRHECWLHVDGAYGAFAALAPSGKALCRGLGQADSVALDPHKWLYSSMGCGCVLYRDAAAARAAFAHDAEYIRPVGLERDEAFAFWDFGPELSRPFRALSVWLQIQCAGAAALGEAIERNIQCAKYFERLIQESGDCEMLAPVELSVFCFRYAPRTFAFDLDAFNERVLVELQRAGHSYLSNARLRGRFALRGCVVNYRTTERDMEILLEDVRAAAGRVLASAIR